VKISRKLQRITMLQRVMRINQLSPVACEAMVTAQVAKLQVETLVPLCSGSGSLAEARLGAWHLGEGVMVAFYTQPGQPVLFDVIERAPFALQNWIFCDIAAAIANGDYRSPFRLMAA
jgi:hypothetical protein